MSAAAALPIRALVVLGTRPEAVKLLPVIRELRTDARFAVRVAATGQHREMVAQILEPFAIAPDVDLDIMSPGQTLNDIAGRLIPRLDALYTELAPHVVIVQGDTTSAFCAGLAAFHRRVAVAHVEAGLRSGDRLQPYPEEANRRMLAALADLHLAPTPGSAANLEREGVPAGSILVTGNTAIDTLLAVIAELGCRSGQALADLGLAGARRYVLVTVHRRESWAPATGGGRAPIEEIFAAVRSSALEHEDVDFIYPIHRNPGVREPAARLLGGLRNVRIVDPLPYVPFVGLMARAAAILTDSGGIQEEAPSLGVPALVVRETTERPEGLAADANRLVGTGRDAVRHALAEVLRTRAPVPRSIPVPSPFGDGGASRRIREALLHIMGHGSRPAEFTGAEGPKEAMESTASIVDDQQLTEAS